MQASPARMDSVEERWVALQASAPPRPTSAPSAEVLAALKAHRRAERAFLSELEPQLRERLTGKRRKAVDTEAAARAGGIANQTPVDALEFFSGIGCLHFGLCAAQRAAAAATVAAKHTQKDSQADVSQRSSTATASPKLTTAPQGWSTRSLTVQPFEIHDVANKVYAHNFRGHDGYRQPCTQDIRSLTAAQLDAREAWLWLLSPPCQPYTRLGKRRDHEDPRAAALLHLISLLPTLMRPPTHLLLENVVGFEVSETARRMRHALTSLGYEWREYHISPTDLGLPNQRLRYFLLARRREHSAVEPSDANVSCTDRGEEAVSPPIRCIPQNWDDSRPQARSSHPAATPLSYFLDDERGSVELLVSASMLERYGHLLDVRSREDSHCLCFTKNYTRSATGAVRTSCAPGPKLLPLLLGSHMCRSF